VAAKALLIDDKLGDYTTQYIGDLIVIQERGILRVKMGFDSCYSSKQHFCWLVVWKMNFIFHNNYDLYGRILPIDFHIFQDG